MIKESAIVHQTATHWVRRELFKGRTIYKVLRTGSTHSVVVATYDLGDKGLARSIADCGKRTGAK